MVLARSLTVVLMVIALGLSACAAIDIYPSPRPIDLPAGLDEGLITRDWDGGHPIRLMAFLANPVAVVFVMLVNHTLYNTFVLNPEFFGSTNQDELYRLDLRPYP